MMVKFFLYLEEQQNLGPSMTCIHLTSKRFVSSIYGYHDENYWCPIFKLNIHSLYNLMKILLLFQMAWSKIKVHGFHPSPRAGCCGVLYGSKWYITGGGSRKKRMWHKNMLMFLISLLFLSTPTPREIVKTIVFYFPVSHLTGLILLSLKFLTFLYSFQDMERLWYMIFKKVNGW